MSEYDHKKSTKIVGQLYPVLIDKAGNVIDGFHRLDSDSEWRKEKHPEIDSKEKLLIARCVANWHRREVPREEKAEWINGLAEIYQKQGLKVSVRVGSAQARNQIIDKIAEVTGLDETTVRDYISSEFKQKQPEQFEEQKPRVPASQVISTMAKSHGYEPEKLVERHREEVKADLKSDVDFMAEAIKEHPEVVSKAIKRITERPEPTAVYVPPEEVEKIKERGEAIKEEQKRLDEDPKVQERRRLFKNLSNLQQIAIYANEVVCPNCGAHHGNLVWKCCDLTPEQALEKVHEKLEAIK
jgi:hypothetical protein